MAVRWAGADEAHGQGRGEHLLVRRVGVRGVGRERERARARGGQVRHGEEKALQQLASHVPLTNDRVKYTDPHTKAYLLLQVPLAPPPLLGAVLDVAIVSHHSVRGSRA